MISGEQEARRVRPSGLFVDGGAAREEGGKIREKGWLVVGDVV